MNRLSSSWRCLARAAQRDRACPPLPRDACSLLRPAAAAAPAAPGAWPDLQRRAYAAPRANKAPAGSYAQAAARPANVRVAMVSSNVLAEPYRGEPPRQPLSSWVTLSGWKERWARWVGGAKSIYTISKCRRHVPGWTLPGFKSEALAVYTAACTALAAGDRTALRHLASSAVFSDLKKQIKAREDAGWARVEWALPTPPTLKELEVVQGRLIAIDPKDDNTGFAQLTVRFRTTQRFVAYDRHGRVVAGTPGEERAVDDHWVFERPLKPQTATRWRVAGMLTIPPPLPPAAARAEGQTGQLPPRQQEAQQRQPAAAGSASQLPRAPHSRQQQQHAKGRAKASVRMK